MQVFLVYVLAIAMCALEVVTAGCSADKLSFPGLIHRKSLFHEGESFLPSCEKGYRVAKPEDSTLSCQQGRWIGHTPPCIGDRCKEPPPSIANGDIVHFTGEHASIVSYKCKEFYNLIQLLNIRVQCLFGEWKGGVPKCEDSRCYFRGLRKTIGMSARYGKVTKHNEYLDVACRYGYTPTGERPFCFEGRWNEPVLSPCQEKSCEISTIRNGALTTRRPGPWYLTWSGWVQDDIYEEIPVGTEISSGNTSHLQCFNGYSVQGSGSSVLVTCRKGKWYPDPVCLPNGTVYVEEGVSAASTSKPSTPRTVAVAEVSSTESNLKFSNRTRQPSASSSTDGKVDQSHIASVVENNNVAEHCYCEYNSPDKNLVAYVGNELVRNGYKLKFNSTLKFRCKEIGYHRFTGPKELNCTDCRPFRFAAYPKCKDPVRGDTTIFFDENLKVMPDGTLSLKQGATARLACVGNLRYPIWTYPEAENVLTHYQAKNTPDGIVYTTVLDIFGPSSKQDGKYSCVLEGYRPTIINIKVFGKELNSGSCYLKDLRMKMGVSNASREVTNHDEYLDVVCGPEYTPTGERPLCFEGRWDESVLSPCRKRSCEISTIRNGALTERRLGTQYWTRNGRVRDHVFEEIRVGTEISSGQMRHLHCLEGYSVQGSGSSVLPIICQKGKWYPNPVCLPHGVAYEEGVVTNASTSKPSVPRTVAVTEVPSTESNIKFFKTTTQPTTSSRTDEDLCEAPVAPENGKIVIKPSVPRIGSIVSYVCNEGFRLEGSQSARCLETGKWTSPAPKCLHPCKIPDYISHGKIGVYKTSGRFMQTTKFETISTGTRIKDGEFVLRCDNKYKVIGTMAAEGIVECREGAWSDNLKCVPDGVTYVEGVVTAASTSKPSVPRTVAVTEVTSTESNIKFFKTTTQPTASSRTDGPPCSLESLYQRLPEDVVIGADELLDDIVPYGTSLPLACQDGLRLRGKAEAKCEEDQKWKISSLRCVSGCSPIPKAANSRLIIEPEKEFYLFGEYATFSCPPGHTLTSELQLVVCLNNNWSADEFPDCKNV